MMNNQADIIAPQSTTIEPESFQATLIKNISDTLLKNPTPPCLVRAPTGAGKTFVIAKVLERVSHRSPTLWFWFVPFVNLVQQTEDAIAANTHGLTPVSLLRGRNQTPAAGLVVISTAQSVARAKSRREGYADGVDDTTRSLDAQVALARVRGLKIGLVVDEAHIGLDSQTEFGQFAHWLAPERLIMATATPKDDRLTDFIAKAGFSAYESFAVSRDEVVDARLNKRYIEAVVYDLRQSMQTVTDLQQTVLRQAWKRNQVLKKRLEQLGIPAVPLLLVQVANGPTSVRDAKMQLIELCKVHPAAIGEHSSDEPDPVLMASIANDPTKEVLIFKQSAGTGFDAPRAFVLASTKPVNDPDFAAQFIGRVMRVHRAMRAKFPRPTPIDADLNTAYVYLANAEAQQGFEQAVAATAALRSQLEGQSEKLVARKMSSGAVVYTNKEEQTPPLFYDTELPPAVLGRNEPRVSLPVPFSHTLELPGIASYKETEGLDCIENNHGNRSMATAPESIVHTGKPNTKNDLLNSLSIYGLKAYLLKRGFRQLPRSLKTEQRPEMGDMAKASRMAATRLEISPKVQDLAIATALGKVIEKEVRTELTMNERREHDVFVVVSRASLAREAMKVLHSLPQVEEEDIHIIIDVLSKRLREPIRAAVVRPDEDTPDDSYLTRLSRDAAFLVIRREYESLSELLHEEISEEAITIDAGPLPDAMIFASDIGLEASSKNIYGVMPPSREDIARLQQALTIDARARLVERTLTADDGVLYLAPFDGTHAMGHEERVFAKSLDRASFIHWWHRNPDRKSFSVRVVRGEHKNYFYPDFVVCLEHFPGDEPLLRLIETKESVKDAARKARRASPFYGRVLFVTKDQSKLKYVNEDGSLGTEIDLDDLNGLREWLRKTIPIRFDS